MAFVVCMAQYLDCISPCTINNTRLQGLSNLCSHSWEIPVYCRLKGKLHSPDNNTHVIIQPCYMGNLYNLRFLNNNAIAFCKTVQPYKGGNLYIMGKPV